MIPPNALLKPSRFRTGYVWLLGGLLVISGTVTRPVLAAADSTAEEQNRSRARAKLIDGDGFLRQGDYGQALAAFKEAYSLFPSPKIHYNFGLAYKGLGRNVEALESYEAFLRGVPDAQAELLAKAESERKDLLGRVGVLRVGGGDSGATIMIDGRVVGTTPQASDLRFEPGSYTLVVSHGAGTPVFTRQVSLVAGAAVTIMVEYPAEKVSDGTASGSALVMPDAGSGFRPPEWARRVAWTTGGVAVLSLALATVGWVVSESKYTSFNEKCTTLPPAEYEGGECRSLRNAGDTWRTVEIVGFATAGLSAAVTTGLWYWMHGFSGRPSSQVGLLACQPAVGYWGGACGLRF